MKKKSVQTEYGAISYWTNDVLDPDCLTLFFMHGLALDHSVFDTQVRALEDTYNIIVWDAPGHGCSEYMKPVCMDGLVEAVCLIASTEHIEGFVVVGQSYGGYIAQALIDRHRAYVRGFIGVGASPYGAQFYSEREMKSREKAIARGRYIPWVMLRTVVALTATSTNDGYEHMLHIVSCFSKASYLNIMRDYERAFIADNHDIDITCPMVLVYGEKDTIGNVLELGQAWHAVTRCKFVEISGAGHVVQLDCPKEVTHQIDEFVRMLLADQR